MLFLQTLLYAPGPFFCWPWKPLINHFAGDSYATAYRHFRRDHSRPSNLALHAICLVFQLLGNFGLLHLIDSHFGLVRALEPFISDFVFGGKGVLSTSTALLWSAHLVSAPAPAIVTVLSIVSILVAYMLAPAIALQGIVLEQAVVFVFLVTLVTGLVLEKRPLKSFAPALLWLSWLVGWPLATWGGVLAAQEQQITLAVVALMVALAASPFVPHAPAIGGMLVCRAMAVATGSPLLLFYCFSFLAPVMQGTSHKASGEEATLILLNKGSAVRQTGAKIKIAYEWAHVTYFPSLAFQSIYESIIKV